MSGRKPPLRAGLRRTGWAIASEAVDALSNFFLSIWIARSVSPSAFGAFGLAYAFVQIATMLGRSTASMPMMIKYGGAPDALDRQAASVTLGVTASLGLVGSVVSAAFGLAVGGTVLSVSLAVACVLPGLLLQDACCYLFFARRQPYLAFVNNVTWALIEVGSFLLLSSRPEWRTAWAFTALWGAAASVSVVVSLRQLAARPMFVGVRGWLREHASTIRDLVGETALGQASQQGSVYILALGAGLAGVGGYRAAQVPLGLLRVLMMGLIPMGVAEGARLYRRNPRDLLVFVRAWAGVGAFVTAMVGTGLLLLPDEAGEAILGRSWIHAQSVLVPAIVSAGATAVIVPVQSGLRAIAATRLSVKLRLPFAALQLSGISVGVAVGGLVGGVTGFAVGGVLSAVVAHTAFERRLRSQAGWTSTDAILRAADAPNGESR